MLRNATPMSRLNLYWNLLNEVLSLNAQELQRHIIILDVFAVSSMKS